MEVETTKRCSKCHAQKPLSQYKLRIKDSKGGKKGTPADKCSACMLLEAGRAAARKRKHASTPENVDLADSDTGAAGEHLLVADANNSVVSMREFLSRLPDESDKSQAPKLSITARVDCSEHIDHGDQKAAQTIADIIGSRTMLRWT